MTTSPEGTGRKSDGVEELARLVRKKACPGMSSEFDRFAERAISLAVRVVLEVNSRILQARLKEIALGDRAEEERQWILSVNEEILAAAMKDSEGK